MDTIYYCVDEIDVLLTFKIFFSFENLVKTGFIQNSIAKRELTFKIFIFLTC